MKQPLKVEELQQSLVIEPLQQDWDSGNLISEMNKAIACCGHLTFIDEEMHTVHFTHSSVQQYLCSNSVFTSPSDHCIDLEAANALVGAISVTYLSFPMFRTQLARAHKSEIQPSTDFRPLRVTSTVARDIPPAMLNANKAALRSFRRRDTSNIVTESATIDPELHRRSGIQDEDVFFHYAQSYWLEHTAHGFRQDREKLQELLLQVLDNAEHRNSLLHISWNFDDCINRTPALITRILEYDHFVLAELIIKSEPKLDGAMQELLMRGAAFNGSVRVFEVCLARDESHCSLLEFSLCNAAQGGHLAIVERSLQAGANVNTNTSHLERTALQRVASEGHLPVIEKLFKAQANVNGDTTSLQAAISQDHLHVIERLLQAGADLKGVAEGAKALGKAAREGDLPVIERLLPAGADVNAANSCFTALQKAASAGKLEVVERLLQAGADVDAIGPSYYSTWTTLQAAAEWGNLEMVERLLQAGAEVNAAPVGPLGKTALQAAAGRGDIQIVERLLQAGADVNAATSNRGWTALEEAVRIGHLDIVDRLICRGGDVNDTGHRSKPDTLLNTAIDKEYQAIAEKLCAAGAE